MPLGHVPVHRPQPVGDDQRDRVLLSVQCSLLEGDLGLAPVHADRVRSECLEDLEEDRYPDYADPQTLEIFWPADRSFRIRQFAEAVFAPGDRDDALPLDLLEQALAGIAGLHGIQRPVAREHERQREEIQLLHLRRPVDRRPDGEIGSALLQEEKLARLLVGEELAVEVVLDIDARLRSMPQSIPKSFGGAAPGRVLGDHDGHLELRFVFGRKTWGKEAEEANDRGSPQDHATSSPADCVLPWLRAGHDLTGSLRPAALVACASITFD